MFIFSERVVKKYKFLMTISLSFIFFLLSKDNALASGYTHEHDASCYVDEVALCESHHIRTENKTSTYYCQYCMKKTSHADTRYYDVCDYNYIDEVDAGLYQVCNECNNIRFNDTPFTKSHYYTASVLNCGLGTGETLATISLSSSHNDWTNSNITLSANVNVLHSSFTLASAPYDFGGGYGTSSTYEVASNGTYSVSVKAGNGETKSASITISNIDKTAPSLSISKSTEAWSENGLYIKASAQDSESGILGYSLNGGAFDTGSSFKVMTNGTYTVSVKDYAGNVTSDSITISNIGRDPKIVQAEKEAAEKAAAAEKLAAEKAEAERVAAEKAAAEKAAAEKLAAEKLAAEKAAAEKAAAEKAAAEKAAAEKAAAEKLAAEKLAAEKAAAEKAAAEKAAAEKLAAEKLAAEKAAAEKAAAEKAAAEKAAAEKAAAEKAAAEKAAAEKLAAEKAAAEKAEAEKIAAEKLAAEKAAAEKVAKEKLAAEKLAAEKAAAEKEAAEKAAAAKEALEKAAQEKTEAAIQAAKKAEEEKLAAEKILKEKEEAHAAAANSASVAEKEASKAEAEREEAEKILNEKTKAEVDANKKASDAESLAAAATKDKKTADKLLSEKEAAEKDAKDTALEAERYLKDLLAGNQIAKGETEQSDGIKGLLAGTLGKGKIKNGTYTTDNGEILVADYDEEKGDIDVKGSVLLVKGGTSKGVNGLILVSDSLNDSKTSPMFSEEDILFDGLTAKEVGLAEEITLATDVYTNSDSASIVNGVAFSKPDTKTIFKIGILLLVIALLWFSTFSYVYKIEKGKIKIVSLVAIKKMDQRLIVEISEDKLTNHGKYMIYYSPWVKLTKKDKMVYVMIKERENVLNTDSGLSFTY